MSDDIQIKVKIRDLLVDGFNVDELRDICFEVGIDYEATGSQSIRTFARETVESAKRFGKLAEIVNVAKKMRPNLDWPNLLNLNPNIGLKNNFGIYINSVELGTNKLAKINDIDNADFGNIYEHSGECSLLIRNLSDSYIEPGSFRIWLESPSGLMLSEVYKAQHKVKIDFHRLDSRNYYGLFTDIGLLAREPTMLVLKFATNEFSSNPLGFLRKDECNGRSEGFLEDETLFLRVHMRQGVMTCPFLLPIRLIPRRPRERIEL